MVARASAMAIAAVLAASLPWAHRPRAAAAGGEASFVRDPVAFLRREGGLTAFDLGSLERGSIIAKVIDTGDRSEVFSLAVIPARTNCAASTPLRAASPACSGFTIVPKFSFRPDASEAAIASA